MSHKGNKLIKIPASVNVTINDSNLIIKGKLGSLTINYPKNLIKLQMSDNTIKVSRVDDQKQTKMYHGTINSNITNAIIGVDTGFKKTLKIVGVGYRASISQKKLILSIGFSHPVEFVIPDNLNVSCVSPTQIDISGFDKIQVGEFAAKIRAIRPPEPYKGKGIMYDNEHIIRKVGKTAESGAAAVSKPTAGAKK